MHNTILDNELEELKSEILRMGALIEKSVCQAIVSLIEDDVDLAQQVIAGDDEIDGLTIDVQNKCLRLLAQHRPQAIDLRGIQADMQTATDLEGMGDCAEKMAKSTLRLHGRRTIEDLSLLSQIGFNVKGLVTSATNSYSASDVAKAKDSMHMEGEINGLNKKYFNILVDTIREDPNKADMAVQLLYATHCLERIAGHAANIGEAVIYMVTGEWTSLND
ncbi:phosphate signaling complex protein PhoU [Pelotomaculum propionicicum]|uniref:Phosphate-specific transport system accessory protein PhoU n=1 Tax=Pelotomaculum propionicicum TaxID=258475 RepID=A0A4Y7RX37_9FIRM|nr:phosphate signaling complex protein PhoU [Pelotomaculum propionicicum]NLI13605.1 phosphate signaling complex protein PhoU [Peptococcaceae bacterium]TEB13481.1 Phosphate-specific transport system accessory protein PhoU [Pelotomaculum propionicicum]